MESNKGRSFDFYGESWLQIITGIEVMVFQSTYLKSPGYLGSVLLLAAK